MDYAHLVPHDPLSNCASGVTPILSESVSESPWLVRDRGGPCFLDFLVSLFSGMGPIYRRSFSCQEGLTPDDREAS